MPSNKTFCIRPWTHACVRTNGDITLCCRSTDVGKSNLKKSTIEEWWSGEFLLDIRKQMLSGEQPDPCRLCYEHEAQGAESLRQKSNREYKIIEKYAERIIAHVGYPPPAPIDVELQLTNLCNLKCLMCHEDESSSIYAENKKLNIHIINNDDYKVTVTEVEHIKEWLNTGPKRIIFRGGEPFMSLEIKQILQWALSNNLLDQTEIWITTNITKLDDDWVEILKSIANLKIMLSLDSIGRLSEYIRFGSNWPTVENNIRRLKSITDNIIVHAVIQNLNILYVDELIVWCNNNNLLLDTEFLLGPEIYRFNNLPQPLLDCAFDKLTAVGAVSLASLIEKNKEDLSKWNEFKQEVSMRDNIRKTSIVDVLPELKEYWHA